MSNCLKVISNDSKTIKGKYIKIISEHFNVKNNYFKTKNVC